MAVLALTGSPSMLGRLPGNTDVRVAVVASTARDNGDGTWSVTAHAGEDQIAALEELGCTVQTLVTDAQELADFEVIDTQIDDSPPVA